MTSPDFKIEVEEKKNYWQRMASEMILWLLIAVTLGVLFFYFEKTDLIDCVFGSGGILLVLFLKTNRENTYFITELRIENKHIYIAYSKRNKAHAIDGEFDDYFFRTARGGRFSKIRRYFSVVHNGRAVLTQYAQWGWENGPLQEAVEYIEKVNFMAK
jgi:hypothetical protein